jgi:hypothetical protein
VSCVADVPGFGRRLDRSVGEGEPGRPGPTAAIQLPPLSGGLARVCQAAGVSASCVLDSGRQRILDRRSGRRGAAQGDVT